MKNGIDRRNILRCTIGLAFLMALGTRWMHAAQQDNSERMKLIRILRDLLSNRRSADAIGSAYLVVRPEEANVERLLDEIVGTDRRPPRDLTGARYFRQTLHARIHQDFVEHKTVHIDGWLLSITECRLCALLSLS